MKRPATEGVAPTVKVGNRQRRVRVDTAALQKLAGRAFHRILTVHRRGETDLRKLNHVHVWLISDRSMSILHRRFLNIDGPTDVVTFQHGEIFISVETARRNARLFRNSLPNELRLYVIHGLLHLDGFRDDTRAQGRRMRAEQKRIAQLN